MLPTILADRVSTMSAMFALFHRFAGCLREKARGYIDHRCAHQCSRIKSIARLMFASEFHVLYPVCLLVASQNINGFSKQTTASEIKIWTSWVSDCMQTCTTRGIFMRRGKKQMPEWNPRSNTIEKCFLSHQPQTGINGEVDKLQSKHFEHVEIFVG